jgi:hypothetical protein
LEKNRILANNSSRLSWRKKSGQQPEKSGKCQFWTQKTPIFVNLDDFYPRLGVGDEAIRDGP